MAYSAFGFKDADAKPGDAPVRVLCKASEILGLGDAVVLAGDADKIGVRGKTVPTATRGAATGALFGYIQSFDIAGVSGTPDYTKRHKAAADTMYANVVPFNAHREYLIRADGVLATTNVGNNCLLATIANADTSTGMSTMEVSASSMATSQTAYQMTLLGVLEDGSNALTDAKPVVRVKINSIQAFPGFGGV